MISLKRPLSKSGTTPIFYTSVTAELSLNNKTKHSSTIGERIRCCVLKVAIISRWGFIKCPSYDPN